MHFLSPFILAGLALAVVPLVIHLLNRRRFSQVDWAPMKYLKLTLRTNRRRLRLEQWLLLLARTLVVVLLILAVARPVLSGGGLSGLLAGRGRTARIVVLDDSLSMGYRADGRSAFEDAKLAAAAAVRELSSQDSLTLRLTSAPRTPLARDAHTQDAPRLLELIAKTELSHTDSRWAATLQRVEEDLAAAVFPVREVTLITDLRRHGWDEEVTAIANRWADAKDQRVTLRVIDVGTRRTDNIQVVDLRQEEPVGLPGNAIGLSAEIRNDQPAAAPPIQAILTVGEQSRPLLLPELPPGQTTRVPITVRFDKPGVYPVALSLPPAADALAEDNARWLTIRVRDRLKLALLDGEPGTQPFESETDFLAVALTAGNDAWQIEQITDPAWLTSPADGAAHGRVEPGATPDVLVLANVAALSLEQVKALEKRVGDGAGLMIFVGDQVDAQAYNERLFRHGEGLLPVPFESVRDEPVTGLLVEPLENSPLEILARLAPEALARIGAKRSLTVGTVPAAAQGVRVLARWNDADGRPAVIEKTFGRGRVILWTLTADRAWSDWPIEPTYVLAVRSAALLLARGSAAPSTLTVGQPVLRRFEGERPLEPRIIPPGNESPQPLLVENAQTAAPLLRYAGTSRAGIYAMTWKDAQGRPHAEPFAVNPDGGESQLEPIGDEPLAALLGRLKPQIVHPNAPALAAMPPGNEIWRLLAMALLTLMVLESLLALWVGRER